MLQKSARRCLLICWLIGAAAGLITGCGSSMYSRLDLALTVDTAIGEQTYIHPQDATAALIYYHILHARQPPPNAKRSCPTAKETFTFHFSQSGKSILDVRTVDCYLLVLSDNTARLPDTQLWDLTNQFAGRDVAPQ